MTVDSAGTTPHVVMVVGDDVPRQSPVRGAALAAAALGARVTVLGVTSGPRRWDTELAAPGAPAVRIVRVPVDYALRAARAERHARWQAGRVPPLVADPRREALARRRLAVADRAAASAQGATAGLLGISAGARRFALRAAGLGRRRAAGAVARGAGLVDRGRQRLRLGATARRSLAELDDLELAVGPVLDDLAPDVLHVFGVRLLGVAAAARGRAARQGRTVRWIYEPGPADAGTPRAAAAWAAVERRHLRAVDQVITGPPAPDPATARAPDPVAELPERLVAGTAPGEVPAAGGPAFLAIGPANSAGQGWAWGRAAERHLDAVTARVIAIRNGRYDYPADDLVDPVQYRTDSGWQLRQLADARFRWTHALFEAGRPLLGGLAGRDFTADALLLDRAQVRTGLVLHGSEVRDPRRHAERHGGASPFADPRHGPTRTLQARVDALAPLVHAFAAEHPGRVFVSTPDQLDDVPEGTWLPVVVDPARWSPREDILTRAVPLVVHAPSNPWLKGTDAVEAVLRPLADRGRVDFRLVSGLPPAEAAALIATADVVVDQLRLGLYGVLACEAMASGTLVLGHLGDTLRGRVDRPVPVVEVTPRSLGETLERVLDDRDWARRRAAEGPGFVQAVHDGRRSAAVLAPFLGRGAPTTTPLRTPLTTTRPAEVPGQ